ncbi:Hypothetical protein NTJ_05938 [Nesidiocoris tenuis]|uniref:Uncharacterized protein n=1 Tax=Nesidiocoris tenuis TaxID=355587 RepID=A0ABN7ALN0_9HEMI|nr:Hypothetical protein NTJ_05938 [Nesidiocoris tenuis]
MKLTPRTSLFCLVIFGTSACSVQMPRRFIAQPFNRQDEETSKLEDLLELTKPALHTMLKGLAALLLHMYPEINPPLPAPQIKKEKDEEPIKIFRQIMQIPGSIYPMQDPSCYPNQPTAVSQNTQPFPNNQQQQLYTPINRNQQCFAPNQHFPNRPSLHHNPMAIDGFPVF